jgi:hypothetical protein
MRPPIRHARFMTTLGLVAVSLSGCSVAAPPQGARSADTPGTSGPAPSLCEDGRAWQKALEGLPPAAVQRVQGTYTRNTCDGTAQVSGTDLALQPEVVESAEWVRLFECRTAHVHFTATDELARTGSPSWAPAGWIDITLERENKQLILRLSAESVAKNIRLYRHARALVGASSSPRDRKTTAE